MTFVHRIGTFFILLGIALIVLFILSDLSQQPSCGFLLWGSLSLGTGIFLWFRDPVKPGPPPERFRMLKRMMGKKPEKKN